MRRRPRPRACWRRAPPRPYYRKAWFWGVVGVVAVTTVVIILASSSSGPNKAGHHLGDMGGF